MITRQKAPNIENLSEKLVLILPKTLKKSLELANLNNAEGTSAIDLLSNGFKIKASSGFMNRSGETMIYMAFASAPLVGTNNIPATAR